MTRTVDFYYDYGSPTAYLAWTQLPDMCIEHDALINYCPILLGGVFKETGNTTPAALEPKKNWLFDDIQRHAELYNVPYKMNPHFIVNTMSIMRGAMWASNTGCVEDYNAAMFNATWVDGKDTSDPAVIKEVMTTAKLDAEAMQQAIGEDELKKQLIDASAAAVKRGVFGVPTMFAGDVMHFGQDRLLWVEAYVAES